MSRDVKADKRTESTKIKKRAILDSMSRLSDKRATAREYPQRATNKVVLETNFHRG